jgi:hypothetical protein
VIDDALVQRVGGDTFRGSSENLRPAELDDPEHLVDEYEEAEGSGHAK